MDIAMLLAVDGFDDSGPLECSTDLSRLTSVSMWEVPYSTVSPSWLQSQVYSGVFEGEQCLPVAISGELAPNSPSLPFDSPAQPHLSVPHSSATSADYPWSFLSPDVISPEDALPLDIFSPSLDNRLPSDGTDCNDFMPIWDNGNCSMSNACESGSSLPQGNDETRIASDDRGGLRSLTSPLPVRSWSLDASFRVEQKGLSDWGDSSQFRIHNSDSFTVVHRNKRRRMASSPSPEVVSENSTATSRPFTSSSSPTQSQVFPAFPADDKGEDSECDSFGDGDADDYQPSRSPSPGFKSLFADSRKSRTLRNPTLNRGKTHRNKGSKAKGSAALALALATQARLQAQNLPHSASDPQHLDPVRVYQEGGYVVKKRKNQPIPVPVPIPNLNKKSRGRKVPFVSDLGNVVSDGAQIVKAEEILIADNADDYVPKSNRTRRKGQPASGLATDEQTATRSFVCVIPGCGKCFVRGEHLKRHVRSIHTHDKPHVCPFEGCDKSFSRRDNLGQHVRIHLQP